MHATLTPAIPVATARLAGALYLVIIVCGIFGEAFVRGSLVVADNPAATAHNILAAPSLFRLGFVADTVMALSDVALAVLLYVLFKRVNETLALMAMVFRLLQAAILGTNLLNHYAALLVLGANGSGGAFSAPQLETLSLLLLSFQAHGYDLGLIFFGINCLLIAVLIKLAPAFPNFLGVLIGLAGLVYLTGSFLRFLAPALSVSFQPVYVVPVVAETAFCLWLLSRRTRS